MKHLIICREYPPAPSGGIGTYVDHISHILAEQGETVHVIDQSWAGAEQPIEERQGGSLCASSLRRERPVPRRCAPCPVTETIQRRFAGRNCDTSTDGWNYPETTPSLAFSCEPFSPLFSNLFQMLMV